MTEDISRIYNSLLGKDKRKEKYYFAIDGLSTTKEGNELRISLYPLKKKGSADIFKDVVDEATRSNYEKIEYREYPSYASEFPTFTCCRSESRSESRTQPFRIWPDKATF